MKRFGARLREAIASRGPLCVGVDPHPSLLASWGLADDVDGLTRFSEIVIEAVASRAAAVKPQSAFFERFGTKGVAVLESTIRQLHAAGAIVVLDVKRGDIGSTAAAYADAYLADGAPLAADAITASPYLGVGALRPMIDLAVHNGRGVFVLARTSNPEGTSIQRAVVDGARTVAQLVVDEISQVNTGVDPVGDIGVVLGATVGGASVDLAGFNGPILLPGLGVQGGRPEDLCGVLGDGPVVALASYSRQVLSSGPSVAALRGAADRANAECASVLKITN
ncbi:MAG: orotidine-5'-phosphate decarboxylase [Dactylosporangium sp.]|nr:orotidine-5'-phosphate decarboxylase [Dactylosporangium sp.]NNJ59989.1 orotidine-5'-phosphate decarboxylase [Dactylosporangium sp.]